jgi:mersacidin/lichenicidin family type 2 lantibiotic
MAKNDIIRAWKDPEYRSSLNAQECALLPASPAGAIDDGKLAEVAGGMPIITGWIPCTNFCSYICPSHLICPT